jgi:sialidase-1
MRALFVVLLGVPIGALATREATAAGNASPEQELLFEGQRIPSLVVSKKGTLLAFCAVGDNHPGGAFVRRSEDNGETWGKKIAITPDGRKLRTQFASVSVVADRQTGILWLFYNQGTDRWNADKPPIRFTYSEDDGLTWKEPVRPYDCARFDGDLPPLRSVQGRGIQLESGRLLAPCFRIDETRGPAYLYSDDHGKTWQLGKPVAGRTSVEFCTVELTDGTVYMNGRRPDGSSRGPVRWVAWSKDGGITFSAAKGEPQLTGAPCHAGLVRLTDDRRHDRNRLLFSLPHGGGTSKRIDLKVWLSYDEGKTWNPEHGKILKEGGVAYSDLAVLPDMTVGCLYESNKPWHSIYFTRFTLGWLTDGRGRIGPGKISVREAD